jgi:hypothetical protein
MSRHYGLHPTRHYPGYAPKVLIHRIRHRLIGPLLGCSCSRCFYSRWRLIWSREFVQERVTVRRKTDDLERRLRRLEQASR